MDFFYQLSPQTVHEQTAKLKQTNKQENIYALLE